MYPEAWALNALTFKCQHELVWDVVVSIRLFSFELPCAVKESPQVLARGKSGATVD